MKLDVKLFATLKEKAQTGHFALELQKEQPTVKELLTEIIVQIPSLESSMKSALVAVNGEFAFPDQVINANDKIALFPPVSGG